MSTPSPIPCAQPDCPRQIADSHYWAKVQAQTDGWFTQKDGRAWCPDHTPEWVADWRAKRAAAQ